MTKKRNQVKNKKKRRSLNHRKATIKTRTLLLSFFLCHVNKENRQQNNMHNCIYKILKLNTYRCHQHEIVSVEEM